MAATVDRLEAERDEITGVVITSAKKTFFAGGDLHDLRSARRRTDAPQEIAEVVARSRRSCAASRRSASRSSRRSTAPRSAAASRSASPATTGSRSTTRRSSSASPRFSSGCCPAPAASCARCGCWGSPTRCCRCCCRASATVPRKAKELGIVDELVATREELVPAAKAWIKANPDERVQPWDAEGYKIPGGHAVEPEVRAEPAGVPGQPAQAAQGRQLPGAAPHHGRGRRGRRRSTSTTRSRSRAATSSTWSPSQVAKNMIQAFFFDMQRVNGERDRPEGIEHVRAGEDGRARRRA